MFVHTLRKRIADRGVRSHLRAALRPRPIFRCRIELFADPALTVIRDNVPALDVPDWARWIASFGVRAQTNFQKADQRSVAGFRDENNERQRSWGIACKDESEFLRVFFGGRFRPERFTQTGKSVPIRGLRGPDVLDQSRFLASLGMTILRFGHLEESETKMDLGSIMWTPLLPSTSSVMWRSAETLASM